MIHRTHRFARRLVAAGATAAILVAGSLLLHLPAGAGKDPMSFAADMAKRGNWREAKYRWEQVAKQKAANPRVLNNLAVAHEALGDSDKARRYYDQALALSDGDERIESNRIRFDRYWSAILRESTEEAAPDEFELPGLSDTPPVESAGDGGKGKPQRVSVQLPVPPRFDATGYRTVLVARFLADASALVDVPREMVRFIRSKLRKDRDLEILDVTPAPEVPEQTLEDLIQNAEFWKYLGREFGADLVVSGVVDYDRRDVSGFEDVDRIDPTTGQKVRRSEFTEQERFSYTVQILFFEGSSGSLVYRDRLQRSAVYRGSNNDPITAFFDLSESLTTDVMGIVEPRTREDVRIIFRR